MINFMQFWAFVMGIHQPPMNAFHKGPALRSFGVLVVSLIKPLNQQSAWQ